MRLDLCKNQSCQSEAVAVRDTPGQRSPGRRSLPPISNQATQRIMRRANVERAPIGLPCALTTELTGAFDAHVEFGPSDTALDPADQATLVAFVQSRIAAGTSSRIRVDGHASVDGPEDLNWRLSCQRAIAVRDELVGIGIPIQDIVMLAHGETSEFSTAQAPNRRATFSSMQPAGSLPALQGARFLQTAAIAASPLPADTIRTWRALSSRGDLDGALRAVVWAMEQRGEIDMRLLRTQPSTQPAVCSQPEAIALDPTIGGAVTTPCGCLGTSGSRTPNPRIRIRPTLVTNNPFAPGFARQINAEVLHSTLIHEFRHVIQEYEKCNGTLNTAQGVCTDCNSPEEMDSYLAEIEAGYDRAVVRHAWVRVFVNQDFLSASQRGVFQTRIDAALQKINRTFPGVDWNVDPEVLRTRSFCDQLGPSPPHVGTCGNRPTGGGTP